MADAGAHISGTCEKEINSCFWREARRHGPGVPLEQEVQRMRIQSHSICLRRLPALTDFSNLLPSH